MKTRIILSLVMLLTVLSVKAQEPVETKIFPTNQIISPHKIEVTFQKTVHILFPSEVKYVDLGSFDIIADKATGAENVVRIKAAVKGFEGETNFSVITADGCFYSFNVVYKDEPAWLSIEMEDWLRDNPEGGIAGDRMFVKLKELGGETPLVVNRIMYTLYKKNKRDIRHVGCKKYGIQTLLKGLYINNDLLYLHTSLRNSSDISFDIDYIRFKIIDKKVAKRTAMQENFIEPVRTSKYWKDYEIAPMAANVQWIFYHDKAREIWVKFLLNEKEMTLPVSTSRFPYYRWETVCMYLKKRVEMAKKVLESFSDNCK